MKPKHSNTAHAIAAYGTFVASVIGASSVLCLPMCPPASLLEPRR
jgi:hypothetical protein